MNVIQHIVKIYYKILNLLGSRKINCRLLYIASIFIFLYSCDYNPRCISADDFGQPRGTPAVFGDYVEPRYGSDSEYNFLEKTRSTYTGFILTGEELELYVLGAWSPWSSTVLAQGVCGDGVRNPADAEYYGKVCDINNDFTAVTLPASANSLEGYAFNASSCGDTNVCWFPHGLGVYIGFSNDPVGGKEILRHLLTGGADPAGNHVFRITQSELESIKASIGVSNWKSVKIYLRMHDNFYPDNSNGCIAKQGNGKPIANPTHGEIKPCSTPMEIKFISGARKEDYGFLENAAMVFIDPAQDFIETAYNAFVGSSSYQNILHITWALFFAFVGIGYLAGFIQLSKGELMSIALRMGVVFAFLSPTSWSFFNGYLISAFWEGTNTMANMVLRAFDGAINSGGLSSSIAIGTNLDTTILQNVDDILNMFLSEQLNSKIAGLLFSHELGWLLIIALYFAFFVFIAAMFKLTVILIFVFITLTILLSLGPIFILFAVFKYTRNLYFQNWLVALLGAAIQPMMLFAFVGLFLSIVSGFLHDMLYYEVCWQSIFSLVIFDVEFWKITEVWNYNNGSPTQKFDGAVPSTRPNIDLIDIFILFLSSLLIRYVTDMVPKISQRIAGGISLEAVSTVSMQVMKTAELFVEEMSKSTLKGVYKRVRDKTISPLADKVLPSSLARHIGGTEARKLEKARIAVRKEMRKKGWSDKEIEKGFKSGALKSELEDHFAYERAKDVRYGRTTLNPAKVALGALRGAQDNFKLSGQKAMLRAQGKKLTPAKEHALKKQMVRKGIQKAKDEKSGKFGASGKVLDKKVDNFMAKKYGNSDLRSSIRELKAEDMKNKKDGKEGFKDQGELREALHKKMEDKGYSPEDIDKMIDKDLDGRKDISPEVDRNQKFQTAKNVAKAATGGSVSRIKNQFGDLPEKANSTKDDSGVSVSSDAAKTSKADVSITSGASSTPATPPSKVDDESPAPAADAAPPSKKDDKKDDDVSI